MSSSERNLFLCGFMGAGKSTVGPLLAKKLKGSFLDLDAHIETKFCQSVAEIFATKGEAAFRKFETDALKELAADASLVSSVSTEPVQAYRVVSLGGGTLKSAENLELVLKMGPLVYLQASTETLLQRLGASGIERPLLAGLTPEERRQKIAALLEERAAIYQKAPVRIQTDGKEADLVATEIFQLFTEKAS